MQLPKKLLESLEGIEGFDKEAFERVHESGEQVTSIRINPFKLSESAKVLTLWGGFRWGRSLVSIRLLPYTASFLHF
jgi:hypothetical protein